MRIRDIKLQLWLNDSEADRLERNAGRCRMSKSAYIRNFINGYEPACAPPAEYHQVLRELRSIGVNINQIMHRAHVTDDIRAEAYCKEYAALTAITDELARAFLPRKAR